MIRYITVNKKICLYKYNYFGCKDDFCKNECRVIKQKQFLPYLLSLNIYKASLLLVCLSLHFLLNLYFCHCDILENCILCKTGEHGEINEKELQHLNTLQKNQTHLPPLVYLNLNDTDVQQSNQIIHSSSNSRNNSSPASMKNISLQKKQQTTSCSASLNQPTTECFYEIASNPHFDRNSSMPPISIPSTNSRNINSSSNTSHQVNTSIASSYEEGKDLDGH